MTLQNEGVEAGIADRNVSMAQVDAAADDGWKALMLRLVRTVALEKKQFNADHVFDLYDKIPTAPTTHDNRAFGPVMTRAAKAGICRKADIPAVMSRRRKLQASPIQVWESLLI